MTDLAKKTGSNQIDELFQQAEEEELNYNWDKEIEILKNIEKICSDKKLKEIEAKVNYKLGEIYQRAKDFQNTTEQVFNCIQLSTKYLKNKIKELDKS